MYYTYFGLKEAPFSIAPNPDYLLMTERHQEALAHLYHGIESDAGFVLLTGEIGTGKTTVCRRFLNSLPDKTQLAFILNPCLDDIELLQAICNELGIDMANDASLRVLSDSIYQHLLQNHQQGINTVLLIDEAQQMNQKTLELIRLLTNLETDTQKLLKIILVGQPELNDLLNQPALLQLSQRITARYHIKPLSINELTHYVAHRLSMAGYKQEQVLFSSARIKQLFSLSQGIPRVVNVICDRALLGVYSNSGKAVTHGILNKACDEVGGHYSQNKSSSKTFYVAALLLAVLLFSCSVFYYYFNTTVKKNTVIAIQEVPAISSLPEELVIERKNTEQENIEQKSIKQENITKQLIKEQPIKKQALELDIFTLFDHGFLSEDKAISVLFNALSPNQQRINSCDDLVNIDWRCDHSSVLSWADFKAINRPSVIHLFQDGQSKYLVLLGLKDNQATMLYQNPEDSTILQQQVSLVELGQYWDGSFVYLWQAPAGFERFIYKKSPEDHIYWLADLFAQLDNQDTLLAETAYNARLKKRIEIFQQEYDLKEDGKAGTQTLLKLNDAVGVSVNLQTHIAGSKD